MYSFLKQKLTTTVDTIDKKKRIRKIFGVFCKKKKK